MVKITGRPFIKYDEYFKYLMVYVPYWTSVGREYGHLIWVSHQQKGDKWWPMRQPSATSAAGQVVKEMMRAYHKEVTLQDATARLRARGLDPRWWLVHASDDYATRGSVLGVFGSSSRAPV